MANYKASLNCDINGTSLSGTVAVSYDELVEVFGEPNSTGDEYKVSTEWVVTDGKNCLTVYDYKETNLYSPELPNVEDFRHQPMYDWHVGSHGGRKDVERFALFLSQKLGRAVAWK